jgi:isoquinoline 1-oxidoreductase beta subunit
MTARHDVTRREFVRTTIVAGGSLLLAFAIDHTGINEALGASAPMGGTTESFFPNVWLRIDANGDVTIIGYKSEMGQGVWTALPMIVAEELDADWSKVHIQRAPTRPEFDTETGGSSSVSGSWDTLRRAGAVARLMLVRTAARRWSVPESECITAEGVVMHAPSGRHAEYGSLVADVAGIEAPDPKSVVLKEASAFKLVGTSVPRLDTLAKVTGQATFGLDVNVPGMLVASVLRCPVFGGRVKTVDDRAARHVPGVRDVITLDPVPRYHPGRVAVVATDTWSAMRGRQALRVEWDLGPDATYSTDAMWREARSAASADDRAKLVASEGSMAALSTANAKIVEAQYEVPFVAHLCMEPMNCTAHVRADSADIWVSSQFPAQARRTVARLTGLAEDRVNVNVTFLGGGFGRRAYQDFVIEAVELSQRTKAPVKVVWSREDDVQHDFYRPAQLQQFRAVLDARGFPAAWHNRGVGPSQERWWNPTTTEPQRREGGERPPYNISNYLIDFVDLHNPVPMGAWRAVQNGQNAFCFESFVDECAAAASQDPSAYRLALLEGKPRQQAVVRKVLEMSSWAQPLPKRRGRGIAFFDYAGTYVAQVVEVSVTKANEIHVDRVCCAFDCGMVVHPDTVRAQIEGSIVWGLSAALYGQIDVRAGRTVQSNFHDYRVLRMSQTPRIDVELMRSAEPPTGVGEPAVPPVAPALANALFSATGKRLRRLPLRLA